MLTVLRAVACARSALPTEEGGDFDGWAVAEGVQMSTEENLSEIAAAFGIDRMNEHTYDSDNFPKVIFRDMAEDERCDHCGEVIE